VPIRFTATERNAGPLLISDQLGHLVCPGKQTPGGKNATRPNGPGAFPYCQRQSEVDDVFCSTCTRKSRSLDESKTECPIFILILILILIRYLTRTTHRDPAKMVFHFQLSKRRPMKPESRPRNVRLVVTVLHETNNFWIGTHLCRCE